MHCILAGLGWWPYELACGMRVASRFHGRAAAGNKSELNKQEMTQHGDGEA